MTSQKLMRRGGRGGPIVWKRLFNCLEAVWRRLFNCLEAALYFSVLRISDGRLASITLQSRRGFGV